MTQRACRTRLSEHLYELADICNVYAIVDGEHALVIDAGSGAVLDHLNQIGVTQVEWVLHTHHHRLHSALLSMAHLTVFALLVVPIDLTAGVSGWFSLACASD